ncbi:hypothetical protein RE628_00765 [Paenibacillus sp. D2_2]|uniref:hypothetical protein n=1 Tax=Paenibacillus sp. D2_2 TaxID=3073092 RepID=UPI0028162AE9|nr:hypothetical protein [Paenibacillus sp. D2_2]WMT41187.1 hypothetical protein RE628_00765 [Paenibacillus sp. D2_2]
MTDLVNEYAEVVENVKQFNDDLEAGKDVTEQLSQFKHWYYISELDMFGPSKFIGYKGMTSEDYHKGDGKDGRDTEKMLVLWFVQLSEEDTRYTPLLIKLNEVLHVHKKSLRKNAKIHVLK